MFTLSNRPGRGLHTLARRAAEAMAVDGHRSLGHGGVVDDGSVVDPSLALVESPGRSIASRYGQPGAGIPRGEHQPLGFLEQQSTDSSAARLAIHVELVHLIAVDHREPDNAARARCDGGAGKNSCCPRCKRLCGSSFDEFARNVTKVRVRPSLAPDSGDGVDVRSCRDAQHEGLRCLSDSRTGALQWSHDPGHPSANSYQDVQFYANRTAMFKKEVDMDTLPTTSRARLTAPQGQRTPAWHRVWPAVLGVLVAAGTAYGLNDARDAAPLVAASGLVYLAAGASGRRSTAWIAFAATFLLITVDKLTGFDALPWMFGVAVVLVAAGFASRRIRPWWSFPLQASAMLLLCACAYIAVHLNPTAGGLLVAAALVGHAGWDVHHHRTGRVVDRSLALFCAILDILVAALVAVLALTS